MYPDLLNRPYDTGKLRTSAGSIACVLEILFMFFVVFGPAKGWQLIDPMKARFALQPVIARNTMSEYNSARLSRNRKSSNSFVYLGEFIVGQKRIALYDNVKFILITLVVIGHFIDLGATSSHLKAQALFAFIYTFHMPLFIFISGLFLSHDKATFDRIIRKVVFFVSLGFALKLLDLAENVLILGSKPTFSLLSDSWTPWFLFALAAFHMLAWLLRGADARFVGVLAVLVALAVGYDTNVGDFLYLSRIIVFFPFFWLGYCLNPEMVEGVVSKRSIVIIGIVIIVAFAMLCLLKTSDVYAYRPLLTGRNDYVNSNLHWYDRLLVYCVSCIMCFAVLAVTPKRAIPIVTVFGERTLQVYAFHPIVLYSLKAAGVIAAFLSIEHGWLVLVPIGVVTSLALSLKAFGIPFIPFERLYSSKDRYRGNAQLS